MAREDRSQRRSVVTKNLHASFVSGTYTQAIKCYFSDWAWITQHANDSTHDWNQLECFEHDLDGMGGLLADRSKRKIYSPWIVCYDETGVWPDFDGCQIDEPHTRKQTEHSKPQHYKEESALPQGNGQRNNARVPVVQDTHEVKNRQASKLAGFSCLSSTELFVRLLGVTKYYLKWLPHKGIEYELPPFYVTFWRQKKAFPRTCKKFMHHQSNRTPRNTWPSRNFRHPTAAHRRSWRMRNSVTASTINKHSSRFIGFTSTFSSYLHFFIHQSSP
jgi:hypothetical protein